MKKIKLSKIEHRNEQRIKVQFEKQSDLIAKIKSIKGRRWSKTKNCWHLPYSNFSFESLKLVFGDENLVYPTSKNLDKRQNIDGPKFSSYYANGVLLKRVIGDQIIVQRHSSGWIAAFVPYDKKNWIAAIQNIDGRKWEPEKATWLLPNVKATFKNLKKFVELKNIAFQFKIEKDIPDHFRKKTKVSKAKKQNGFETLNQDQKTAVISTVEKLTLKQYSNATKKSYRNHLIGLFVFFKNKKAALIDSDDVEKYLLHLLKTRRISESTQNQIINAYKAYAEKVLKKPKEFIEILRPKKARKLPKVLSTQEVVAIISATKNLKHKLCLLLIYSAGLRRGELLNLRRADIHFDRRTIFIKAGKGKRDRYVVLAESAIPYLKKYLSVYNPIQWLIEGQMGGKYAPSSLQKIFRDAVNKAKANPYATLHTLRHSYATHCVEKGHNLKSVQEALGHQSLKTTEIYLHISSDAMKKLKSPLDDLEIK